MSEIFKPKLVERRKWRADGVGERWVRGDGEGREEGGCWLSCPADAGAHSNKMEITAAPEPLYTVSVISSQSLIHQKQLLFIYFMLGCSQIF